MKKTLRMFGLLCLFLAFFASFSAVLADAVWTPENTFFEKKCLSDPINYNEEACVYFPYPGRYAVTNSPRNQTILWSEPNSTKLAAYENGFIFNIMWLYNDENGDVWAVVEDHVEIIENGKNTNKTISGWINVIDLQFVYDNYSFTEEHSAEFKPYGGQLDESKLESYAFWLYPGAMDDAHFETGREDKIPYKTFEMDWYVTPDDYEFDSVYTDKFGGDWVFVEVCSGKLVEGWVFAPDPTRTAPIPLK